MLTITPAAAQVIDGLATSRQAVGLRVTQVDSGALNMGLVNQPEEDDLIVSRFGSDAVVFISAAAAPRLAHAVLDAKSEPGSAAFFLR